MSRDLAPEIRGNMQTIAREEVAIQQLQERVAKLESTTERDRADLGKLQAICKAATASSTTAAGRTPCRK